jgi:hypothetical protein
VIYYDFSKIQSKLIKKDKIAFKTAYNQVMDVTCMILKIEGYILYSFKV